MLDLNKLFGQFIICWSTGQTYVLGRMTGIITLVLLFSTYLAVLNIFLVWWQLILLGLLMGGIILFSGYLYVKFKLYSIELGMVQRQNPELMEIKKDVKYLKELLEARKG